MIKTLLAIFIGGGLGSVARFLMTKISLYLWPNHLFPIATFISNLLASAILAIVVVYAAKEFIQGLWLPFLVIGFCGGFSTFSAFGYETYKLLTMGQWGWAVANVLLSVIACVFVIYIISKSLT